MHLTIAILTAFATFTASVLADIPSQNGFTTTNLFLPLATNGSYITALASGGANDETTTYGIANSSGGLESPYLTATLGPTTLLFTTTNAKTQSFDTANTITYPTVVTSSNCSYSYAPTAKTTHTAKCVEEVKWVESGGLGFAAHYDYTNMPVLFPTNVPEGYDGYVDVYVRGTATEATTTALSTSTQAGGAAEVTAYVKAVVVMVAGAAALAV